MELRESIESINEKLLENFGTNFGNSPKFRVVFSENIFEKRLTEYTDDGFLLLQPEVRLLPKYKQWIHQKYILEKLQPVEDSEDNDLVTKVSYEPLWVFQDKDGNYLPPFYEGCKYIIEIMFENMGRKGSIHPKYRDKNISKEERLAEIEKMEKELFGNETSVTDALAYGWGVGYTTSKTVQ